MTTSETNGRRPRVLIVDDEPDICEYYQAILEEEFEVQTAGDGLEGLDRCQSFNPDAVVLDVVMPRLSGIQMCKQLRKNTENGSYVAVLFLSAAEAQDTVIQGLEAGGNDYVTKPCSGAELKARIRANLRVKQLNDDLRQSNRLLAEANLRLEEISITDDLTGLYNMRFFTQRLGEEFTRARRHNHPLSLLMMDLDRFKLVNDTCNHLMGSYVIAEVGHLLKNSMRSIDIGARYGGDEYVIMLPETPPEGARIMAARVWKVIREAVFRHEGFEVQVTPSIGVATWDGDSKDIADALGILRCADERLYRAKENGRDQVCDS